ncbi:MAG TPA: hypothetical protein VFP60_06875 [Pseudolabrys sp.]|nr:hypothetical protein [Pseudolabrys sp.]
MKASHSVLLLHRVNPRIVLAVLCLAALSPSLVVEIPAMADYPNHLARMFILSREAGPHASPFYEVDWELYPNLAMDLLVPQIAKAMSVEHAMRLFLLVSQLLIITGAMALERSVKGQTSLGGFAALAFLYSLPFAWGFVNFEFGLGLALWCIAAALALQEKRWSLRLAVHTASTLVLFMAHFFALGVYGFTIGVHELWRARSRADALPELGGRLLLLGAPTLLLLALMVSSGGSIGGKGTDWLFAYKPLWLFRIMSGFSQTLSAICVVSLVAGIYLLARNGALRFAASGPWLAVGFVLLYILMPSRLFDTSFVDLRIIVAAALIMPAFLNVKFSAREWRLAFAIGAVLITLSNIALVLAVWLPYRAVYADMIESFGRIKKGSTVLIGHSGAGNDPPFNDLTEYPIYNAPVLAVHFADAFVPNLFTAPGKQPVKPRPNYAALDIPYGGPVPVAILSSIAEGTAPAATPRFIRDWPREFDYLYLLGPRISNPLPKLLEEIQSSQRFVLYRVRK